MLTPCKAPLDEPDGGVRVHHTSRVYPWCPLDAIVAAMAAVLEASRLDHLEDGRYVVNLLSGIEAEGMEWTRAAGADLGVFRNIDLADLAREALGAESATGALTGRLPYPRAWPLQA